MINLTTNNKDVFVTAASVTNVPAPKEPSPVPLPQPLPTSNKTIVLSHETKKTIVGKCLMSIEQQLAPHFQLKFLGFLSIADVCKLVLMEVFVKMHQARVPQSPKSKDEAPVFAAKEAAIYLDFKNYLEGWTTSKNTHTPLQLFEKVQAWYKIAPEDFQKLTDTLKLLDRIHQYPEFSLLNLSEFLPEIPSDTHVKGFIYLTQLNQKLISLFNPVFNTYKESLNNVSQAADMIVKLSKEVKNTAAAKISNKLQLLIDSNLPARVNIERYLLHMRHRRSTAVEMCYWIGRLNPDDGFFTHYVDKFLHDLPHFAASCEKASDSFKQFWDDKEEEVCLWGTFEGITKNTFENYRKWMRDTETIRCRYFVLYAQMFSSLKKNSNTSSNIDLVYFVTHLLQFMKMLCQKKVQIAKADRSKQSLIADLEKDYQNLLKTYPEWFQKILGAVYDHFDRINKQVMQESEQFLRKPLWTSAVVNSSEQEFKAKNFEAFENLLQVLIKCPIRSSGKATEADVLDCAIALMQQINQRSIETRGTDDAVKASIKQWKVNVSSRPDIRQNYEIWLGTKSLQTSLKTCQTSNDLCFNFLIPFYVKCRSGLTNSTIRQEILDSSWMLYVDKSRSKRSKALKTAKQQKFVPKKQDAEIKPTGRKKEPSLIVPQPQRSLSFSQYLQTYLSGPCAVIPSDVCKWPSIESWKVNDLDQGYHIAHIDWMIEMMHSVLLRKELRTLPLLVSTLNNSLYLAQEQALTPLFVDTFPNREVSHGLYMKNKLLGISPLGGGHDKGSFWFRYPNQSLHFHMPEEDQPRVALDINLKLEQEGAGDMPQIQRTVNALLCEGIQYICNRAKERVPDENQAKELSLVEKAMMERIEKIAQGRPEDQVTLKLEEVQALEALQGRLDHIRTKIQSTIHSEKVRANPKVSLALKDCAIHTARLRDALILYQQFPQQKYASVHARNVIIAGQYIAELCGAIHSLMLGDEMRTHNLLLYAKNLKWITALKPKSLQLLEELNVKKGSDYPFAAHLKQGEKSAKGLEWLNSAYQNALVAQDAGEGFKSVKVNKFDFMSLVSDEVDMIEDLFTKACVI